MPTGLQSKAFSFRMSCVPKATVDEKWENVKQNNGCRKCLRVHHTDSCKIPDGTTCDTVRDATIVPYTMSVYLLQIQSKAQKRYYPQTKVRKLVITMSRARKASLLFVQFKKSKFKAKVEMLLKPSLC